MTMEPSTVTLDVREDVREGREPFRRIMDAVGHLRDGDTFRLIAPFEPVPLINLLNSQGLKSSTVRLDSGDFEVVFSAPIADGDDDSLLS